MRTRIAHQLGRCIKTHRLAVEQASEKRIGVVALEPAAVIGQQRKTGGVALGETVFTEALDLLEDALGVVLVVALGHHAPDQPVVKGAEAALPLPGGHGAAQLVGLAGGEVGREHRDLHHLLLKDRHALGSLQRGLQLTGVVDVVVVQLAVLQVGVDHAALDGAGPHDRHLHHQVVITTRLQARQHAHLGAALDLEHADGVGRAEHVVGGGVAVGHVLQLEGAAELVADEVQRALQGAQHAQREDVDLHQAQRFEVDLLPLDDAAVFHGGVFHRHQLRELVARDHEATRVLAQVAREADELACELHPQLRQRCLRVEALLAQAIGIAAHVIEPLQALRHRFDALQVDAQGAPHVTQRRARPVADDHGGERGAVPTVLLVDVLDDFFAALVLEIDVDVGRLVALGADETLEQQRGAAGVDLGHAQAITNGRVGGTASALAKNALPARPLHDVGHGEEIALIVELLDEREFVLDLFSHFRWQPVLEPTGYPFVGELAQLAGGCFAGRHGLLRVFVFQLAEREAAAACQLGRLLQPLGAVQGRQPRTRTQSGLGVGLELPTALRDGDAEARGRQHVLQGLARTHVHQHTAGGRNGQAGGPGRGLHGVAQGLIARVVVQLERDDGTLLEPGLQPLRVGQHLVGRLQGMRHQQGQTTGQAGERGRVGDLSFHVTRVGQVVAFVGALAGDRDPVREVAVAAPRLCQQHETCMRLAATGLMKAHLAADDQVELTLLGFVVRAHHARQRALVGQCHGGVPQLLRSCDQLFRVRGPFQKTEVAEAMQLGIGRELVVARRHGARPRATAATRCCAAGTPGSGGSGHAREARCGHQVLRHRHADPRGWLQVVVVNIVGRGSVWARRHRLLAQGINSRE